MPLKLNNKTVASSKRYRKHTLIAMTTFLAGVMPPLRELSVLLIFVKRVIVDY